MLCTTASQCTGADVIGAVRGYLSSAVLCTTASQCTGADVIGAVRGYLSSAVLCTAQSDCTCTCTYMIGTI
jgi:hypothetical protein